MVLPSPPVLKTTIIQLNKELDPEDNSNNYEILTNDYNNSNGSSDSGKPQSTPSSPTFEVTTSMPNKKKRRRSTANIDSEELAKRKNETKQLHSIIEKRRRIKINREFEALKYLIPACRNCNSNTPPSGSSTPTTKKPSAGSSSNSNNNGNKIDGMYKLTILKSSVEYILYLHHVIQKQQELISNPNDENLKKLQDFDIDFAKIPLNVNQYRNIDKDFNFKDLLSDLEGKPQHTIVEEEDDLKKDEDDTSSSSRSTSAAPQSLPPSVSSSMNTRNRSLLPTPDFTPDMAPILTILNKYSTTQSAANNAHRKNSYPVSPQTIGIKSQNPSPFTVPMKSSLSNSSSPSTIANKSYTAGNNNLKFALPDPAVNPSAQLNENIPRKKFDRGRIPEEDEEMIDESSSKLADQDASKTLLALRKSSIDNLLN
ncbi:Transcriptional regulator of yeast-form-adherence 6 [Candida viswanathii]|uniref:Transcriptional regulator of yeast-form-adherence 6 n=1 Tax=Candida viswanathii TaxID=5486 RepID=A0A367XW60_9ASCO|nr:Transcriptional regulator of yeast-form-adherence 6 [Candida viswanathii]